ncbi:peptide deformylase [Sulfitobacter mediterraneus]|uniref:peptide deformylase n=1 Tax=Sulfitobacter mediterraneus TaxID=83219 RepID=UPI001931F023|nr:peptide deformylase [Sulfitobacter mediterraneus]MBM1633409.1 peptide deformylase [Sulfitobacter mediterraneus]MBM1640457.1 peptide deformylase [Sulfitobacter mediterraneus]MBM1645274.1 peptide deformylase [Sulfitobacter mediterraneus]MBM1648577.1 peptide deformylase [Sulfitobacter mediterraneus]MBM1652597.1 peptide deformylase [Sulfitobacter mediterraneus]
MSVLPIVLWPDPRLAEICAPVNKITPEIETLARDMLETMYAAPGRGLAGPQVGAMLRIFVMDIGWKEGKSDPLVCINPMLQEIGEDRAVNTEGCLSIPGVTADVSRPSQVQMVWTGLNGGRYVQSFDGFGAVCAQHELDHLDGVVTFDHLDAQTRADLIAEYEAQ